MTAVALPPAGQIHSSARLEKVFNGLFADAENTLLIGGADEPLYEPGSPNRLFYREDFFASALHEIAHWCIAGVQRRQQVDFGYWYAPEGRNENQQGAFESVEAKPQALEWYFSQACGYRFQVSADNLSLCGELRDNAPFKQAVLQAALAFRVSGLPRRASLLMSALAQEFDRDVNPGDLRFDLDMLC